MYEDNLLRVADPSFVAACHQHTVSRYYSCDTNTTKDTEILNDRIWLTCPTYIGRSCIHADDAMGARGICSRGGQIRGLETKVPQRGPGMEPGGSMGAKPPEADDGL